MAKSKEVSLVKKRWLTLEEAAMELGEDAEGMRQAMESGDLDDVPIFVYSGVSHFPASLIHDPNEKPVHELPDLIDAEFASQGGRKGDTKEWFWLTGTFRLSPGCVRSVARNRTLFASTVTPPSWWDSDSKVITFYGGEPTTGFWLAPRDSPSYANPGTVQNLDPIFRVDNLRFRSADIDVLKHGAALDVDAAADVATEEESSMARGKWPWGSYETQGLRNLAAAAKRLWVNYDPTEPTTAPTKKVAVPLIMKEFGLSRREASAIASMLRADGLKSGPRR